MLARRFLFIFAGIIVLVIAGALAYRLFAPQLMEAALVPSAKFVEAPEPSGPDYARADLWFSRPGIANDPSSWVPAGVTRGDAPRASLFFIHPTSYLSRAEWNAAVDDPDSANRARLFVRSQASAFNDVAQIWAPRYRQATFGAFLTSRRDAELALGFAYRDVAAAFDRFLLEAPADRPIILAAHSQGSSHLVRLLRERVAGKPLAGRIAAAYVVGWPVSLTADIPAMGLPACRVAADAGCILGWQSFAEPADASQIVDIYEGSRGFTGGPRRRADMMCTNPVTGNLGDASPLAANLGTLKPNADLSDATLVPRAAAARCTDGFLLLGTEPPQLGPYVLPGNNYHVFDYALFWANIRADAARRLDAFAA